MDPSDKPLSGPESARLDGARGAFREALAALRNVTALARSKNVGPKAILSVVPDVRQACGELAPAIEALLAAIQPRVCQIAGNELEAFLAERLAVLNAELEAAQRGNMAARDRLRLEQTLDGLIGDLDAARSLLTMLESAVFEPTNSVMPGDLLLQTYAGPPSGGHVRSLITTQIVSAQELVVTTRPRALAAWLACAVEFALEHGEERGGTPQISIAGTPENWSAVATLTDAPAGDTVTLWAYGVIPPTLACLHAAAESQGGSLSWDQATARLEYRHTR